MKLLYSTGNVEEDAKLMREAGGDRLVNKTTFEEAKEREKKANEETAKPEDSHNALTEQPRMKGQVLAVLEDEPKELANNEREGHRIAVKKEIEQTGDSGRVPETKSWAETKS
jgi:hypothetical protein